MLRFAVVCGAVAMFGAACGVHEPPQPGGTGQYLDAPTGVVDVMPDGVFPAAMVSARSCEAGEFSACAEVAFMLRHGAEAELESPASGTAPVIGVAYVPLRETAMGAGDEGHGDEGHGDEGHGDEGHGDEGHGDEGHGDEGHGDEGHGGGHGGHYDPGAPVPEMPELAAELFAVSCNAGWYTSCSTLADMMLHGETPGGNAEAQALMQMACDGGVIDTCRQLADAFADGTFRGGVNAAMPLYEHACWSGSREACAALHER